MAVGQWRVLLELSGFREEGGMEVFAPGEEAAETHTAQTERGRSNRLTRKLMAQAVKDKSLHSLIPTQVVSRRTTNWTWP